MSNPENRTGKINLTGWLLLCVGIVGFPLISLLPYYIHANQYYYILASTHPFKNCVSGYVISNVNQCMSWQEPSSLHMVTAFGLVALAVFGILVFKYIKNLNLTAVKRFTNAYVLAALITSVVSAVAYTIMHSSSQNRVISVNIPHGFAWVANHEIPLGYGLTLASFVLATSLYLIFPITMWFQVRFGSRYIGGIKKKELFQ